MTTTLAIAPSQRRSTSRPQRHVPLRTHRNTAERLGERRWARIGGVPTRLAKLNLDTSRPGFYDDAAFLAAERGDPKLLEAYAGFVDGLTLDQDYFKYARERVRETASFLLKELKADGRQGACIDLASAVSRFLERQGVWNYLVKGALTLSFPASSGLSSKHFWPIGNGPSASGATAAHVWVRAPPFVVVDLTVAMQPYSECAECFLPDAVIAENAPRGKVGLSDLLDPEAREELRYRLHREPKLNRISQSEIQFC